jgi:hypothetical protein
VTQVVEHLCNKCEALSSNPSTTKKRDRKRKAAGKMQAQGPHLLIVPWVLRSLVYLLSLHPSLLAYTARSFGCAQHKELEVVHLCHLGPVPP